MKVSSKAPCLRMLHAAASGSPRQRPQSLRSPARRCVRGRKGGLVVSSATPQPSDCPSTKPSDKAIDEKAITRVSKMLPQLRAESASELVRVLQELGVTDGKSLQRLMVKQSVVIVLAEFVRTALNLTAAGATGFTFWLISGAHMTFPIVPMPVVLFSLAVSTFSLAMETAFSAFNLIVVAYASIVLELNADAVLEGIKRMAAAGGGSAVTDTLLGSSSRGATRMLQLTEDLSTLMSKLKGEAPSPSDFTTAERLAAYFVLENNPDFEPAEYGLSQAEALEMANEFSKIDTNQDGQLSPQEVDTLAEKLSVPVAAGEAVQVLDEDSSGGVSFLQFAHAWAGMCALKESEPQPRPLATPEASADP